MLHEPGSNRVPLDIEHGTNRVNLIHRCREEPTMPEMADSLVSQVEDLRVDSVCLTDQPAKSELIGRCQDKMYMIRHQTPGRQLHPMLPALLGEVPKIELTILIVSEHDLPIVSPLGDMVRNTRNHDSCMTRHG